MIKEDINDPALGWSKYGEQKEKNGMGFIMWQRPYENGVKINKSESVMRGVSVQAFRQLMQSLDKQMSEAKHVKEFKILERREDGAPKVMYSRSKMPFMSEREALMETSERKITDKKYAFVSKSIERDDVPIHPGAIRMNMFRASEVEEVDKDLKMT